MLHFVDLWFAAFQDAIPTGFGAFAQGVAPFGAETVQTLVLAPGAHGGRFSTQAAA